MARTTKAQLEAENKQLRLELEQNRKELTMNQTETVIATEKAKEFDIKDYLFKRLIKAYKESENKEKFCIKVKNYFDSQYNGKVYKGVAGTLNWLYNINGLKVGEYRRVETADETGKVTYTYEVEIKEFNPNVETVGKYGKYKPFKNYLWAI